MVQKAYPNHGWICIQKHVKHIIIGGKMAKKKRRGLSKAALKELRRKHGLGEFRKKKRFGIF